MSDTLQIYLQEHLSTISSNAIVLFKAIAIFKKTSKGEVVTHSKKPSPKFYIIQSGLVGNFTINKHGKQLIQTIYTQHKAFGALSSYIEKGLRSNVSYECLTNCELYEIDCEDFINLKLKNKEFGIIYNKVLEKNYLQSEKKIDEICLLNSTERYLKLQKEIPGVSKILPQYQIAYFLNITTVQLSRIKRKLKLEKET